jgi:hypothetical protein
MRHSDLECLQLCGHADPVQAKGKENAPREEDIGNCDLGIVPTVGERIFLQHTLADKTIPSLSAMETVPHIHADFKVVYYYMTRRWC